MKGETTLDQRVTEQLKRLEEIRKYYSQRFTYMDRSVTIGGRTLDWPENLVGQLIADATYLATYYGLDLETIIEETVKDIRRAFPDVP